MINKSLQHKGNTDVVKSMNVQNMTRNSLVISYNIFYCDLKSDFQIKK